MVDKMFLMFPEFRVDKYDKVQARADFNKEKGYNKFIKDITNVDLEDVSFNEWWNNLDDELKDKYKLKTPRVYKVGYKHDVNDPKSIANMNRAQRDNMLIDISYAILSHPAMAMNVNNPGSFDKIKRISRVTEIAETPEYRDAYIKEFKIKREQLAAHLMEQDLDTLDGFLKKFAVERNPLSIDTFLYNHKQNTTGGTLIGIYANGTTGQAKFQESGLSVKESFTFKINSRTMDRLDQQRTAPVKGVRELISKNSAEWSAASVDNVKDPVLAKLWQSKDTANITIALIRMGCTIDEVGLLFKHPVIQYLAARGELTSKGINTLLMGGDTSLRSLLEDLVKEGTIKINNRPKSAEESNINTQKILEDLCMTEQPFSDITDIAKYCSDNPEAGQRLIDLLSVFKDKIIPIADALSELTRTTRADSPNGAIQRSLSRALNQRIAVDNMRAKVEHEEYPLANTGILGQSNLLERRGNGNWAEKDELREVFNSEKGMVSPFYTLGIDAPIDIISTYFKNYSAPILEKVIKMARDSNAVRGTLKDETMDDLFFEMTTFLLSKTKLFGDDDVNTFEEKRNYYLYEFPKELIAIKQSPEYADINNLTFMKKLQVIKGEIMLSNGGKLTPSTRMLITQSIDSLLYMEGENQEKAHQLAVDLMAYSYYRDGFRFGPNNYGSFFSNTFLNAFPELVGALRSYDLESNEVDRFLEQFIANHPWQTSTIIPTFEGKFTDKNITYDEGSDNQAITVKGPSTINLNLPVNSLESYQVARRILVDNGTLYQYVGSETDNKGIQYHHYSIDTTLRKSGKKFDIASTKYNANMSKDKLCAIPYDKEKLAASKKLFSSSKKGKGGKSAKIKANRMFNANDAAPTTSSSELAGIKSLMNGDSENASEAKKVFAEVMTDETNQKHTTEQINFLKQMREEAKRNAEGDDNGNSATLEEQGTNHQDDTTIGDDTGVPEGVNLKDVLGAFGTRKPIANKKDYSTQNTNKTKFC